MTPRRKPSALIDDDAAGRVLAHQISAALKHRDALRQEASTAKAELKIARKKYKQAKRAAKDARKVVKKLKRELESVTFAAADDKQKRAGTKKPKQAIQGAKKKLTSSKLTTEDAASGIGPQSTPAELPVPAPIPHATLGSVADAAG